MWTSSAPPMDKQSISDPPMTNASVSDLRVSLIAAQQPRSPDPKFAPECAAKICELRNRDTDLERDDSSSSPHPAPARKAVGLTPVTRLKRRLKVERSLHMPVRTWLVRRPILAESRAKQPNEGGSPCRS